MNFLQGYADKIDALGPHAERVGKRADDLACEALDLLRDIRGGTNNLYGVDVFEYVRWPFAGADTGRIVSEGREGYQKRIKNIAVVAPAAVNVDVFFGDASDMNFVWREPLSAAGRSSRALDLPIPEGAPILVVTSAAVQVNLIVKRVAL